MKVSKNIESYESENLYNIMNTINKIITYSVAIIWFVNGMFCKMLNLVPRHQQIVEEILGGEYSRVLTILIGGSEVVMCLWILSRFKTKLNAYVQIIVVALMNIMEFILVPDLLLWGYLNIIFAMGLILLIYYNEFILSEKLIIKQYA